jgi:hypothetical protein
MAVQGMLKKEREYISMNEGVVEGLRVLNAEVVRWGKEIEAGIMGEEEGRRREREDYAS